MAKGKRLPPASCFLTVAVRPIDSFLVAVIMLTSLAFAEEGRTPLQGRVIDIDSKRGIANASVVLRRTGTATTSDADGGFAIRDLTQDSILIEVTAIGYDSVHLTIALTHGRTKNLTICLTPKVYQIDGIVVTASRFTADAFAEPRSVVVVTRSDLSSRSITTTADCLFEEPGITIQKTTCGHGSPILRGLLGTYVSLLYNGVRLNKSTWRFGPNQYLNTTDPEYIDQIEVVKGPTSVMYGSDAIGGTVNLIRQQSFASSGAFELKSHYTMHYSSANDGQGMHGAVTLRNNRIQSTLNIGYNRFHDLRAGGAMGFQRPTGWKEYSAAVSLGSLIDEHRSVRLEYTGFRQQHVPRYDKYVDNSNQLYEYDPQNRDLVSLTLDGKSLSSFVQSYKLNLSYQREREGRNEQKKGSSSLTISQDKVYTLGCNLQFSSFPVPHHWLVYGVESYGDWVRSERYRVEGLSRKDMRPTFPDKSTYQSSGLFVQDRWQLNEALSIMIGGRLSHFHVQTQLENPYGLFADNYLNFTETAAVEVEPCHNLSLYGSWAAGFRAPNLDDVAVLETTNSGIDAPNPALSTEKSNCFEVGAKTQSSFWKASLALYYSELRDIIDRRPGLYDGRNFWDENGNGLKDPGELDVYQKQNVGRARVYGAEFQQILALGSQWEVRGHSQWTWGENVTNHEPLSRIPPLSGLLAVRFKPVSGLWFEIFGQAADTQRRLSSRDRSDTRIGSQGTSGWNTLNLRGEWGSGLFKIDVILENITDRLYKTHGSGVYSSGLNGTLKLSYGYLSNIN